MRSVTAAMRGSRVMAARSGRGCGRSFRGSLPESGTPVHAQSRPRGGEGEADREFQRVGAVHRAFEQASLVLAADQQQAHARRFQSRRREADAARSEEHTSELQSLMRISYAVFCLKKKK